MSWLQTLLWVQLWVTLAVISHGVSGAQLTVTASNGVAAWGELLNTPYPDMSMQLTDTLLFVWQGTHTVEQLAGQAAFDSCDFTGSAELAPSTQPPCAENPSFPHCLVFKPTSTGDFFFACIIDSHCTLGLKIKVTVSSAPPPPPPTAQCTYDGVSYADETLQCLDNDTVLYQCTSEGFWARTTALCNVSGNCTFGNWTYSNGSVECVNGTLATCESGYWNTSGNISCGNCTVSAYLGGENYWFPLPDGGYKCIHNTHFDCSNGTVTSYSPCDNCTGDSPTVYFLPFVPGAYVESPEPYVPFNPYYENSSWSSEEPQYLHGEFFCQNGTHFECWDGAFVELGTCTDASWVNCSYFQDYEDAGRGTPYTNFTTLTDAAAAAPKCSTSYSLALGTTVVYCGGKDGQPRTALTLCYPDNGEFYCNNNYLGTKGNLLTRSSSSTHYGFVCPDL